jgi:hypothetical protein
MREWQEVLRDVLEAIALIGAIWFLAFLFSLAFIVP